MANDAYSDDADWFDKAAAVENEGMTPSLEYPRAVQEPETYTPQALSGSISSIDDDIRARESSWDRLVNDGGREWAKRDISNVRSESAAAVAAAEARAEAAARSAYITRTSSAFRDVVYHRQVRALVNEAKWDEVG